MSIPDADDLEDYEDGTGIDSTTQQVIWAIAESDGTAAIGEIRDLTGIDSYSVLNYRLKEKLEPRGMVELLQPESPDGRSVGKVARLTGAGEELAEQVIDFHDESHQQTLADRLDVVETRLTALEEKHDQPIEADEAITASADEFATEMEEMKSELADLRGLLTAQEALFDVVFGLNVDYFRETDIHDSEVDSDLTQDARAAVLETLETAREDQARK